MKDRGSSVVMMALGMWYSLRLNCITTGKEKKNCLQIYCQWDKFKFIKTKNVTAYIFINIQFYVKLIVLNTRVKLNMFVDTDPNGDYGLFS